MFNGHLGLITCTTFHVSIIQYRLLMKLHNVYLLQLVSIKEFLKQCNLSRESRVIACGICVNFFNSYVSAQSLSHVWLFATTWTAACQASLSITNSWSLLKLMYLSRWCHPTILSSVIPFSCLYSFPASGSFQMSQLFASGSQSTGVSASTSVLPMKVQDWFPLGWTGWISLQSKGLSRVFSNTTLQSINSLALRFLYSPTLKYIHDHCKNISLG